LREQKKAWKLNRVLKDGAVEAIVLIYRANSFKNKEEVLSYCFS